ncbi:MAG: glycolate oxidase subunit GlcE [Hyphomicrobiales bacterium]|nr:glycolate oxidase subunit GlcE [Hyphomicrobiales bacterium]
MTEIIEPECEIELAEFVRGAVASKSKLRIVGGGSKQALGNSVTGKHVSTSKLHGIVLYEPASLTIVADAGTPLEELEDELSGNGQHLPFEPSDYRNLLGSSGEPTIGAVVACGISGPRRIQTGSCRDSLIGVRFINGDGDVIKSGGRVMKNVTGYDLVKLLAGSYGTLGIITQVSFKLLPAPEKTATVILYDMDDNQAVGAMSKALGSPFDLSGAAHMPKGKNQSMTLIRLEGFEKSVDYRAQKLAESLSHFGEVEIESDSEIAKKRWKQINNIEAFANRPGAVWRLSLKPGDSPGVINAISQSREIEVLYDWGGGLVWLLTPIIDNCGEKIIRNCVNQVGGHSTLIRAPKENFTGNAFHPQSDIVEKISTNLRLQFDPHSILNSGKMSAI